MNRIPENRNAKENKLFASLRGIVKQLKCVVEALTTGPIANPTGVSCDNPTYVTLCDAPVDFEYKAIGNPLCYECPDGSTYQVVLCKKYENGVEVGTETIVLDGTGIIPALPECAVPCTEEPCSPWMGGGLGDTMPTGSITDFTITLPKCGCSGIVKTSIGDIPFNDNQDSLCFPPTDCTYTIDEIILSKGSTCTLTDVLWYASKRK